MSEEKKGVIEVYCESWLQFLEEVAKKKTTRGAFYRGQSNADWKIESSLTREARRELKFSMPDWTDEQVEAVLVKTESDLGGNVMQSYGSHYDERERQKLTDQQLFMSGRHQGLITPFVDWSRSPFVAAFFGAVEVVENFDQNSGGNFCVVQISSWMFPHRLEARTGDHGKLARHALQVNAAIFGNTRGIAQRGVATYLYPPTDIETFIEETATIQEHFGKELKKFIIPHTCAEDALNNLHQMNINYSTLFPDAYGLAKQANLNLYMNVEGMGNWAKPPGFDTLIPEDQD